MLQVRSDVSAVRERLSGLLRRQAGALDRLARRTYQRIDPARVHDLRVLIRRIRAAVWVARELGAPVGPLRRQLRRLGRALGARRMLDVAVQEAGVYGLDARALGARLAEAGEAVRRLLRPAKRAALLTLLREAAAGPSEEGRLSGGLARRGTRLADALERAPRGKREMHRLRIEAKKTRYTLEALGRQSRFIKPLQERLGRAHDLEVLQELLGPDARAACDERKERAGARRLMKRIVLRALQELAP